MTFSLPDEDRIKLNAELQSYLRRAALRRPSTVRIGPFVVTFDDADNNPFLNYAIPDDNIAPGTEEIDALIDAFDARRRKPRLEYVGASAAQLEPALLAHGFSVEARVPIMLCKSGMEVRDPATVGLNVFVATRDEDLAGAEAAQAEAFGGVSQGPDAFRRKIRYGGLVVAACDPSNRAIVGCGTAMVPLDGISEITGVGVRPDYRRRGAAGAITALLAREAFSAGLRLLWLTPGSNQAERIYARAGFVVASEALHISR